MTHQRVHLRTSSRGRKFRAGSRRIEFTEGDRTTANELFLWATNDSQIYRSTHIPWVNNLKRKMKNGTYNEELAFKGIRLYYVPRVIQGYQKEFGDFPVDIAARVILAGMLLKKVKIDISEGV